MEGTAAVRDCIAALKEGDAATGKESKMSIVKLACRGLVLLLWERHSAAHAQPQPVHVVAELIRSVQQKERQRLKCACCFPDTHFKHMRGR